GQPFLPFSVGAFFDSFDPSICNSTSTGTTTAFGVGQTGIHGAWQADSWISWGGPHHECEYSPVDVLRDALCSVLLGPDHVRVDLDEQGVVCQGTLQVRQIHVQVVDINN